MARNFIICIITSFSFILFFNSSEFEVQSYFEDDGKTDISLEDYSDIEIGLEADEALILNSVSDDVTIAYDENAQILTIFGTGYAECSWQDYAQDIKEVVIEEGITGIDNNAFCSCKSLEHIVIPKSLVQLNGSVISDCPLLRTVGPVGGGYNIEYAWDNMIPANAFSGCKYITSVSVADNITTICDFAFYGCENLSHVELPTGITQIGGFSFAECIRLSDITIPQSVFFIGGAAFFRCQSLTEVIIPDSVTTIGNRVFAECSKLEHIYVSKNLKNIGFDGFLQDCDLLKTAGPVGSTSNIEISWENEFPSYSFCNCNSLVSIEIPEKVSTIKSMAFMGCSNLTDVSFPQKVESIGCSSFKDCKKLSFLVLPDKIATIGHSAFYGCSNLKELSFPSSLTEIGEDAFYGCSSLQYIDYAGDYESWMELSSNIPELSNVDITYGSMRVIFDANGGEIEKKTKEIVYGESYGELPTPNERTGYFFLGWFLSKNGYDEVYPTTIVTKNQTHTLYAKWEPTKSNAFFDNNYSSNQDISKAVNRVIATKMVTYDEEYGTLPGVDREGYLFEGWFTSRNGGEKITSDTIAKQVHDVTFYAKWSPAVYNVSFILFDDNSLDYTLAVKYDEAYGELPIPNEREGYLFDGWFTKESGGQEVNEETVVSIASDHTLFARWASNEFRVYFDANGGDGSTYRTVSYGKQYGELPIPTRNNYYFAGWYTEEDGGELVTSDKIVSLACDHQLFAHWSDNNPSSIRLNCESISLTVNDLKTIGAEVCPTTLSQSAIWFSSNSDVAEVTNGTVKAISPGRTTITATTLDNKCSAYCEVFVASSDLYDEFGDVQRENIPEGIWTYGIDESYYYSGNKITPVFSVYCGSNKLIEKLDYSVAYKNNLNAGKASVIITGKGNYSGKHIEDFEITKLEISENDVDIAIGKYNGGKSIKPKVSVVHDNIVLKENKDYKISYKAIKTVGTTKVTITGLGNYQGTVEKDFIVKEKNSVSFSNASVRGLSKSYELEEVKELASDYSVLSVIVGGNIIEPDNYIVKFLNCNSVGKGTVLIKPSETSPYVGEKRISINVTGIKLGSMIISSKGVFDGKQQKPLVEVYTGTNGTGDVVPSNSYDLTYSRSIINAGNIVVTAKAKADKGYYGKVTAQYKIDAKPIDDSNISVTMPEHVYYAKGGVKPSLLVNYLNEDGITTLREGIDYTVTYYNNLVNSSKKPYLILSGKGNYTGKSKKIYFEVEKRNISNLYGACADILANNKKVGKYYYSKPIIYDINGKTLKENTDYTVTYINSNSGNEIGKSEVVAKGSVIKAVITAKGKNYIGTMELSYRVIEAVRNISFAKVEKITDKRYSGKAQEITELRLSYITKNGNNIVEEILNEGEDYKITAYYNNINRGVASFRIEGCGGYSGSKIITYRIGAANF